MNEALKLQLEALAFGVALETVSRSAPKSRSDFEALCETVAEELKRVVDAIEDGKAPAAPAKPKRATRKAAEPTSSGGKRSGIDAELLKAYIGKSQDGAASLQQIADHFSVSKGVAKRAVEALPGVQSVTGAPSAGKRGVPPIVYWVP